MWTNKKRNLFLLTATILFSSFIILKKEKPTLFFIGDSTVKNGKGDGGGNMWGWGDLMAPLFDTAKIKLENDALGGTSSRTFLTKGLWDKVLAKIKKGDYLIMQFGHNDNGALDDTSRARGTIKGVGDSTKEIYNPITKQQEVVHTYGWYLSKFVNDALLFLSVHPFPVTIGKREKWFVTMAAVMVCGQSKQQHQQVLFLLI
jgi:rhamnogalacturonan acetylesterase